MSISRLRNALVSINRVIDISIIVITTASNKGKNENDLDGSLFAINLDYQGLEDNKSKIEF